MKRTVLFLLFVGISVSSFAQRTVTEGAYCNGNIAIVFMVKAEENSGQGAVWLFTPGDLTVFNYTISNDMFTFIPVQGGAMSPCYLASNGDLVMRAPNNEVRYPFSPHIVSGTYTSPKGNKYIFRQALNANSREGIAVNDMGFMQWERTATYDPHRHVLAIGDEPFSLYVVYGRSILFEVSSNTVYSRTD
jgi:hypothetical protein